MVLPERKQIQARLGEAQKLLEAMNGFASLARHLRRFQLSDLEWRVSDLCLRFCLDVAFPGCSQGPLSRPPSAARCAGLSPMWHRAAAMTPRFRHTHRVVRPHDPSRQASLRKHGHFGNRHGR
jgi:hypothetical protein